ncbi:MAG: CAP domain-containing protein [Sediminibacterium sp.]|nr:CAP domain-containing protein [Sediminibacterium sp.]
MVLRYLKVFFTIGFFWISILFGVAQNPDDKLSVHSFNQKYLEHLIKVKIDEVRLQHQLKPLYSDSILFVAAKFHADYLCKKGELSHIEREYPKTETPQKRADFFGAVNYLVGENVAYTSVNVPIKDKKNKVYTNTTYAETAQDFVTAWVNSPGHYKNIITPDYNITGVAIWPDVKTGRIYAVQKFARVLFKYEFVENKRFFDYAGMISPPVIKSFESVAHTPHGKRHAYKLRSFKDSSKCERCFKADRSFRFGQTHIEYKGNAIYLVSYDPQPVLDLLKRRRDGFAAEIVDYDPFDCGNPEYYTMPSRRNGQCIFNGKLLKPVYKRKALKGFKPGGKKRKLIQQKIHAGKVKKYMLKLGKIPKDQASYFEVNLAIIQKRRVCKIMHFSSVCGDTLEKFYELPFYHDTLSNQSEVESDFRSIEFMVPFQKNKTEFKMADVKPIMDSVMSEKFTADTIEIKAFSSVEGNADLNHVLQKKRADNLAAVICSAQKNKVHRIISSEENWTLFRKQIEKNRELELFKSKPDDQIKQALTDTLLQKKIEKFLAPQRIAKVRVHAKEVISDRNIESYLAGKTQKLKLTIGSMQSKEKRDSLLILLDSLTFFMEVAYNKITSGVIKPRFFAKFEIGNARQYNEYNEDRLKYKIQLSGIQENNKDWAREIYEELVTLYNNEARSFFVNYNMLNLIQRYGKDMGVSISDDRKDAYVAELKLFAETNEQKVLADKIGLNFWFALARLPINELPEKEQPVCWNALLGIKSYFDKQQLSTEDLNKLGAFYLYHSMADWVVQLLGPEFRDRKNNPEGLKILAKTLYRNYEETHDTDYYAFLAEVYDIIGKEAWCPMFVGPCNVSFQAFDYETFRNFYCGKCSGYLNYAKRPNDDGAENEAKKGKP